MTDSIESWLAEQGLGKYAPVFAENEIDFEVLPHLDETDLEKLGLPMGPRKKLLAAVQSLAPQKTGQVAAGSIPIIAPRHLSEQVLRSRAALEGERKQVTMLFADIEGSTRMIADMDAETAAEVLRRAVGEMMAAVHQYEGTVNKVLGDGIMAIFGAPIAHEDHAVRACYAALAMQTRIRDLSLRTRSDHGVEVQMRQGLNSGDVVVRAIHNDLTMDYDAIGPTVHLASRMEQTATAGSCRLTAATHRLAEGFVEADSLGRIPVKGIDEPIEVFQLVRAVDYRSRFLASQRGRLTRFVGRDDEMVTLDRVWQTARGGRGQTLSVVGEAGVGKSRLYYEFVHSPALRDVLVLESGSVSHARAAAFRPLTDLLRGYLGIDADDDARRMREKTVGKLVTLSDKLGELATPILALIGAHPDDPAWAALDPAQRRRATLDACRTLLLHEAQLQPLVVIFEDLHWIDPETQAFLDLMVNSVARTPILLLFNYRPEYTDPWIGKTYHTHIRIDPLPQTSGEELLADLLGDAPGLDELRGMLIARTEGYPFYIEETVQDLVEEGVLAGERGAYTLTRPVQRITVPPTIQSVIGARIDRLPPDGKRLLQTASVIGKDFELSLLRHVAELEEASVQQYMATLRSGEFVYETRLFPDPEYTFKHALTHQVAYESLLGDRRREKHADILRAMERLYQDSLQERLERLVHHATLGEDWEAVHRHGTAAGHRALAISANHSAVAAFESVLLALDKLPETQERLRDAVDTRLALRDALFVLGISSRNKALMDEAYATAKRLGEQRRLIEVLLYQSGNDWTFGQLRASTKSAREALALANSVGDSQLIGLANYRITTATVIRGDFVDAAEAALAGSAALNSVASSYMRFGGLVHTFIGSFGSVALAEQGKFAEAEQIGNAAYKTALASNHAYSISVSCFGLAHSLLLRGAVEDAIEPLAEGVRQCDVHKIGAALTWVASRAAYAFAAAGRGDEVDGMIDLAVSYRAVEFAGSLLSPFTDIWLARTCLEAGRLDDARTYAERLLAFEGSSDLGDGTMAWARWTVAEAARRGSGGTDIEAELDVVFSAALAHGMRPLQAHCLTTMAALKRDAALVAKARAIANEIGMKRLVAEIDGLSL